MGTYLLFVRFIKSFMKVPVGHMLVTGVENARLNVEIPHTTWLENNLSKEE